MRARAGFRTRSDVQARRILLLVTLVLASLAIQVTPGRADTTTISVDNARTGWDPNEPGLAPASVSSSNFGQLYSTQLDGQIYAQPLVAGGNLVVATENNEVYGLNPATGTITWSVNLGPAWPATVLGCGDLTPNIGVTSTPVYDPATNAVYLTAKVNNGVDAQHPNWYMHALDPATGAERPGWPVPIAGSPINDPTNVFNSEKEMQRPGLLLLDGVVYVAFGAHCDFGPYRGYVVGVSTTKAATTAMWATESGASSYGAGIWQAGGGVVSDGSGRIFVATANGVSPPPASGTTPPSTLAESVIRLQVNADQSLSAADFFSPSNAPVMDQNDTDLASGGPVALPALFGAGTSHPHLLVQMGKDGRVFLLDRDNLGGRSQGPVVNGAATDAVVGVTGPYQGQWGHPAVWGGDGGYVYVIGSSGPLRALKYGATGTGMPALSLAGTTTATFGYTTGSPIVTSTGTTSGSAVVWLVSAGGGNGDGGTLVAYNAVPDANGILQKVYSSPVGTASKFAVPATDGNRVFVGTRNGNIIAFGRPAATALTGSPVTFTTTAVGTTTNAIATLTATKAVTISAISDLAPFGITPPTLPVTLSAGQTLAVPVAFSPTAPGSASGVLSLTTDSGTMGFSLSGTATQPGLYAAPGSVSFPNEPTGFNSTVNVQVTNTGTSAETVTGTTAATVPFTTSGLPAAGITVAPGANFIVSINYAPTTAGKDASAITITSTSGTLTIAVNGTAIIGAPKLVLSPATTNFGTITIGASSTLTFDLANTGNTAVTVTKAKAPASAFTSSTPLSEGLVIEPGQVVHQSVTFTPTVPGTVADSYEVTGTDGQGAQLEGLSGTGVASGGAAVLPAPAAGSWSINGGATLSGTTVGLTAAAPQTAGSAFYTTAVAGVGITASFTAQFPAAGGDGATFALLDASKATPAAVGAAGGGVGFSGLPGLGVVLGTYWNPGSRSNNYVGVVTGPGTGLDNLTYLSVATVPTALRTGTHTVSLTAGNGTIKVGVDGTPLLFVAVALPPSVLLGFTGGSGSTGGVQAISNVAISAGGAPAGSLLVASPASVAFGTVAAGSSASQTVTLTNGGGQTETVSAVTAPTAPYTATLPAVGATVAPGATLSVPVTFAPSTTGAAAASLAVTTTSGTVNVPLSGTGSNGMPQQITLPPLSDPTWAHNGKATVAGSIATLTTDGQKFAAGDIVNTTPVSPIGLHATFTEQITGAGTIGANGLSFSFLDAATGTGKSLGASGGSLGIGGVVATAVTLQTYPNNGVNSSNFAAIGTTASTSASLTLLASSATIPALRTGTHNVDVTVTSASHLVLRVDGAVVLDVAVTLPPHVLVAFTAGTGHYTDTHTISNPTITYLG